MIKASLISGIKMVDDNCNFREEWLQSRVGKITSSPAYKLAGAKGFGDLGWGYIRTRAYEILSKVSTDKSVTTEATINGMVEEGAGLRIYKRRNNIDTGFLRVQVSINGEDQMYKSTPDGIWILSVVDKDGETYYNAKTVEVKGFEPLRFMECIESGTAQQVKVNDPKTYWQCIDQLSVCNCLTGDLVYVNSQLGENNGGYKEIPFRQVELREDVKFLKQRKEDAKAEIEKIVRKMRKGVLTNPS